MFDIPEIIGNSSTNVPTELNGTVALRCKFRTATHNGVTIVVWLKDGLHKINSTEHYTITTTTNPGVVDLIISELKINIVTTDDQGAYSCYCYYNTSLVTSSKPIKSNRKVFEVNISKGRLNITLRHSIYISCYRK